MGAVQLRSCQRQNPSSTFVLIPPINPSPTLLLPEVTVTTPTALCHSRSELHGQIAMPLQMPLFVKLMNCWLKQSP